MIRILHVIDRLKKVSGIARVILNYYDNIDTSIVQFDFLVVDFDSDIVDAVAQRGGRVYKIVKLGLFNGVKVKQQIEDFFSIHEGKYQIVHSSFYHIDFLLFPIAKKHGVKVCIAHSHNTKYADYCLRSIRNALLCKLSSINATHFVACSKMAGKFQFGHKRVEAGKVFILNNAVNSKKYEYNETERNRVRKELGIEEEYVLGNVGRFNKQKNHIYLFEVFCDYLAVDSDAILLLVGEGELIDYFKSKAIDAGISEKVIFLGARGDVPNILQAMDCYVFPSLYEGLGISLIEAQAAGLPCVAASTIPMESKVTNNVVYLGFNDKKEWVEAIAQNKYYVRTNTMADIINAGYEITEAAKNLENYYVMLV